jgi:hypothetical protein
MNTLVFAFRRNASGLVSRLIRFVTKSDDGISHVEVRFPDGRSFSSREWHGTDWANIDYSVGEWIFVELLDVSDEVDRARGRLGRRAMRTQVRLPRHPAVLPEPPQQEQAALLFSKAACQGRPGLRTLRRRRRVAGLAATHARPDPRRLSGANGINAMNPTAEQQLSPDARAVVEHTASRS